MQEQTQKIKERSIDSSDTEDKSWSELFRKYKSILSETDIPKNTLNRFFIIMMPANLMTVLSFTPMETSFIALMIGVGISFIAIYHTEIESESISDIHIGLSLLIFSTAIVISRIVYSILMIPMIIMFIYVNTIDYS